MHDAPRDPLISHPNAQLLTVTETAAMFSSRDGQLHRRSTTCAAEACWSQLAIIHGYGDHSGRYLPSMHWLAERGVACHAVDLRGQGASPGRRGYIRRWDDYLSDVRDFLNLDLWRGELPRFLLGHSHGALVLSAAVLEKVPGAASANGCILSSPFFRSAMHVPAYKRILAYVIAPLAPGLMVPSGVKRQWLSRDPAVLSQEPRDALLVPYATQRWYLAHQRVQRQVMRRAEEFRAPLLVLAGAADPIADIAEASRFCQRAGSPDKQFIAYGGMMHELLRDLGREAVLEKIIQWMAAHASGAVC